MGFPGTVGPSITEDARITRTPPIQTTSSAGLGTATAILLIAHGSFAENRDLLDEHDTTLELEDDGSWRATPAVDKVAEHSAGATRS